MSDDNDYFPQWDVFRILAHYFTAVLFANLPEGLTLRNDYRFNVIQLINFPNGYTFDEAHPTRTDISLILQNSGPLPWKLGRIGADSCRKEPVNGQSVYNLALSYHIYKLDDSGPACPSCFEGERTLLCHSPTHTNFDLTPGHPPFLVENVTVSMPADLPHGCYRLKWDIELLRNHRQTTWISWLHQSPTAQWPTQDMVICYQAAGTPDAPDPPRNPGSGSHTPNIWSNNPDLAIAWDPPATPVTGYETRYQGAGSNIDQQFYRRQRQHGGRDTLCENHCFHRNAAVYGHAPPHRDAHNHNHTISNCRPHLDARPNPDSDAHAHPYTPGCSYPDPNCTRQAGGYLETSS